MNGSASRYPEVEALVAALRERDLILDAAPANAGFAALFYAVVRLRAGATVLDVPVMDEFGDVPDGNPAMRLNLVLQECRDFTESPELPTWAGEQGLDPADPRVSRLHEALSRAVPAVYALLGTDLDPIPWRELEFNTGMAKALRASRPTP